MCGGGGRLHFSGSSSPVRVSDRVSKTVEGDRRGVAIWAGAQAAYVIKSLNMEEF